MIEVGRREGRYRALRLRVKGGDLNLDSLRVIYGNGTPDDIAVRSLLREGRESGTLDLQGRDRVINRIELRSKRDTKDIVKDLIKGKGVGRAVICVDGLQIDRNDNDRRGGDGRDGGRRDDNRRDGDRRDRR